MPTPDTMQVGGERHTWVTIAVDGTNQCNRAYVHCAVVAPGCGRTHLAGWWLFEGSEMWATAYRMQSECDFHAQLCAAVALELPHADGLAHNPLFLRADGKAHIMLAGEDGFTKKSRGANGPHCCGGNVPHYCASIGDKKWPLKGSRAVPG